LRRYLIAGNWKMNKNNNEAVDLARRIVLNTQDIEKVDMVICPPFTALAPVHECIKDSKVKLGAQNMHFEDKGAYTGEISPEFLKNTGCQYVIIGHSERRMLFGETDQDVNKKIKKALAYGFIPIVCVGETLEEREKGETENIVTREVSAALEDQIDRDRIVFAYEPIWAIGTGKTARSEDANKIHSLVRNIVKTRFGMDDMSLTVLYGGSVKPSNSEELLFQPDIDGSLVGGASLDAQGFTDIIKIASKLS
jgi:triosephosphate isomerase